MFSIKGSLFGRLGLALAVAALPLVLAPAAEAAKARPKAPVARPAKAAQPSKDAALVVDATTGRVLYERNADQIRYPASLTKMMTLYLLFDALQKGTISLDSKIVASAHAVAQQPTKLDLSVGEAVPVETAIKAIVVRSANDVAVVIAEALGGGSELGFAQMMTEKAHQLGMMHTNFHNASGLPDPLQTTTASDLALLARHLAYDFAQYYPYFSTNGFTYRGRLYQTHDNLLAEFKGTDGIKTGYTQMSGFNLVTSAIRNDKHIIGVVMGGATAARRDAEMMRLLSQTFTRAKQEPTLVADANVPWRPGPGPKTGPDWTTPGATFVASSARNSGNGAVIRGTAIASLGPNTAAVIPPESRDDAAPLTLTPTPQIEQGDIGGPSLPAPDSSARQWTIQIGAFADQTSAEAELAKYARAATDLVGRSSKFVVPLAMTGGQTLYRARFGLFAEDEARAICKTMTSRGQACFALKSE
jgi:D-alanyl-D-alanine carboxypeptidase